MIFFSSGPVLKTFDPGHFFYSFDIHFSSAEAKQVWLHQYDCRVQYRQATTKSWELWKQLSSQSETFNLLWEYYCWYEHVAQIMSCVWRKGAKHMGCFAWIHPNQGAWLKYVKMLWIPTMEWGGGNVLVPCHGRWALENWKLRYTQDTHFASMINHYSPLLVVIYSRWNTPWSC